MWNIPYVFVVHHPLTGIRTTCWLPDLFKWYVGRPKQRLYNWWEYIYQSTYLFWWLIGESPSFWPSRMLLTDSKTIGGSIIIVAFNFFLNKSCKVGLRVNVKFQIWSKAIGSIIVNILEAAMKTLKAILATLECPLDRFWNVNSKANHKCWNPTWQPLLMR